MSSSIAVTTPSHFLNGWKEIANYLGKGVRTVQRYEQLGLPVHRPSGKSVGAVITTRAEIDSWVQGTSIKEKYRVAITARGSR